jgi:hypothetical protein
MMPTVRTIKNSKVAINKWSNTSDISDRNEMSQTAKIIRRVVKEAVLKHFSKQASTNRVLIDPTIGDLNADDVVRLGEIAELYLKIIGK